MHRWLLHAEYIDRQVKGRDGSCQERFDVQSGHVYKYMISSTSIIPDTILLKPKLYRGDLRDV